MISRTEDNFVIPKRRNSHIDVATPFKLLYVSACGIWLSPQCMSDYSNSSVMIHRSLGPSYSPGGANMYGHLGRTQVCLQTASQSLGIARICAVLAMRPNVYTAA